MAKKNQTETRTAVENINDTLTGLEQKLQNNSRPLLWGVVIVVAIVCLVLIYFYAIRQPGIEAANNAIGQADTQLALQNDSLALKQYQEVADNYGYAAGNRAALNAAILLYKDGKYQEAIEYLDRYKGSESLIGASAKSLEGDCYVNLKKYDEALKYFDEAIRISNDNPAYTPIFMMKEATVYRELKNYQKEAEIYQKIVDEYPNFGQMQNIDIERYLERAKLSAEAK